MQAVAFSVSLADARLHPVRADLEREDQPHRVSCNQIPSRAIWVETRLAERGCILFYFPSSPITRPAVNGGDVCTPAASLIKEARQLNDDYDGGPLASFDNDDDARQTMRRWRSSAFMSAQLDKKRFCSCKKLTRFCGIAELERPTVF